MKKYGKRIALLFCIVCAVLLGSALTDKQTLQNELIRLHVIAASDSAEDQAIKLRVRDAVLESISSDMEAAISVEAAESYLQEAIPKLEKAANAVLETAGFSDRVSVNLNWETYPWRIYDTFSLPSGIYRSLRVIIGEGAGQNWWCVVFPSLCTQTSQEDFSAVAADAGLSERLINTVTGEPEYEVRFFAMDLIGRIENFFRNLG